MSRIYARVKKFILQEGLIADGDTVFACVSGGIDSMVMLDMLCRLRKTLNFDLKVAHFNHGTRGADADADEEFVRHQARKKGLDFYSSRLKPIGKLNEEKLRVYRYTFFNELSNKFNAKIALAHHRDDQVETVLMRLFRGTGLRGLSGMKPLSGPFIRPLLCLWRKEVERYARERNIPWREDSTNRDEYIPRNFLRLTIIPELERLFPGVKESIWRFSISAEEDEITLRAMARSLVDESNTYSADELLQKPVAIRKRLYSEVVYNLTGNIPSWRFIQSVENLVVSSEDGMVKGKGVTAVKKGGKIQFEPAGSQSKGKVAQEESSDRSQEVSSQQILHVGRKEWKDKLEVRVEDAVFCHVIDSGKEIVLDADRVTLPLKLRMWRAGDRFHSLSLDREVKLKDFYGKRKISTAMRAKYPVLEDAEGRIVGVLPLEPSRSAAVTSHTKKIIRIKLRDD